MEKAEFENLVIQTILDEKGEIRASELERIIVERTGIAHSTFYKRLAKLIEKGLIEKDRAQWRNSIYRLNYEVIPRDRLILSLLKLEVLSQINKSVEPLERGLMKGEIDEADLLEELGTWIAGLSLYALLEEVKTGVPFTEVVHYYLADIGGAKALLKRTIIQRETPSLEWRERLSRFRQPLEKFEDYKLALDRYEEALKKAYPLRIIAELKGLWNKIREGKSDLKLMGLKTINELKKVKKVNKLKKAS